MRLILMLAVPILPEFSLDKLIPLIFILPLIAFWIWMFRAMLKNDDLPDSAKNGWILAFIVLNVFAAVIYYVQEYRTRR